MTALHTRLASLRTSGTYLLFALLFASPAMSGCRCGGAPSSRMQDPAPQAVAVTPAVAPSDSGSDSATPGHARDDVDGAAAEGARGPLTEKELAANAATVCTSLISASETGVLADSVVKASGLSRDLLEKEIRGALQNTATVACRAIVEKNPSLCKRMPAGEPVQECELLVNSYLGYKGAPNSSDWAFGRYAESLCKDMGAACAAAAAAVRAGDPTKCDAVKWPTGEAQRATCKALAGRDPKGCPAGETFCLDTAAALQILAKGGLAALQREGSADAKILASAALGDATVCELVRPKFVTECRKRLAVLWSVKAEGD